MERLALQHLKEWKQKRSRKPLILNGARQVGKTWLLREFAKREYEKEAYVVCRKNELVKQIFSQDFNVNRILRALRALTGIDITPVNTLIILDEEDSRLELDFVIQDNGRLLPIEVKAEANVRANSLTTLLKNQPELKAVRYSMLPYKEQEQLTCVPLYAV